jgi:hypothetical protein
LSDPQALDVVSTVVEWVHILSQAAAPAAANSPAVHAAWNNTSLDLLLHLYQARWQAIYACQRRAYRNGNCAPVQVNVAGVNPVAATKSHTLTVPADPSTTISPHRLLAVVLDPLRSAFGHGSGLTSAAVTPAA